MKNVDISINIKVADPVDKQSYADYIADLLEEMQEAGEIKEYEVLS